jgi:excinuclease ABC subunit A
MPKASAAYVESLSAYARQFLDMMQKPDVDHIEGLSPAISIEQKTTSRNPRSTVGTVTEIYDYMRLLWARVGIPILRRPASPSKVRPSARWSTGCWRCQRARGSICSRRSRAGGRASTARTLQTFRRRASSASKVDGKFYEVAEVPALDKNVKHDIDVVVDRIVVRPRHERAARR